MSWGRRECIEKGEIVVLHNTSIRNFLHNITDVIILRPNISQKKLHTESITIYNLEVKLFRVIKRRYPIT